MERHPQKYSLSEEERKFFDDNGYVIVKGLVELEIISKLRKKFSDICNKTVPRGRSTIIPDNELAKEHPNPEDHVNKLNYLNFDPVFSEYVDHPGMLHMVSQIIGEKLIVLNSMMINKPPGTKWHPPHQDAFYANLLPYDKILTTWTAIDPVSADNGCIFVLPGSHKENTLYQEEHLPGFINDLYFTIPNVEEVAPLNKRVSIAPLEPGDTIFIHSLLVHGSWPNNSNYHRKAITNVYVNNECCFFDVKGFPQEKFEKELNGFLKTLHGPNTKEI